MQLTTTWPVCLNSLRYRIYLRLFADLKDTDICIMREYHRIQPELLHYFRQFSLEQLRVCDLHCIGRPLHSMWYVQTQ